MPKRDLVRRIDLRPSVAASEDGGTVSNASGRSAFDDDALVRRDGTHALYGTARWLWDLGAQVAGTLQAWGSGLVEVIGALYAGRAEGPSAGIFHLHDDLGNMSAVLQVKDLSNVPIFSAGALDNNNVDAGWVNIGREGYPRIHFGTLAGFDRQVPLVDIQLINGLLTPAHVDLPELAANLPIPVVDTLDGLSFSEGQLFLLRVGADSGALYAWTRWGPEPQGGFHRAGPHNHQSFEEGAQLRLDAALTDVAVTAPNAYDVLRYDDGNAQWINAPQTATYVALADVAGYFGSDTLPIGHVEAGMAYLASWLLDIEGRL